MKSPFAKTDNPRHICCNLGKGATEIDENGWQLARIEGEVCIECGEHAAFLHAYEKAVLLALKERGVLTDGQVALCIEQLAKVSSEAVNTV